MRFNLKVSIDLLTGLEAILTGSQPGEKLKCLYENLMSKISVKRPLSTVTAPKIC